MKAVGTRQAKPCVGAVERRWLCRLPHIHSLTHHVVETSELWVTARRSRMRAMGFAVVELRSREPSFHPLASSTLHDEEVPLPAAPNTWCAIVCV